MELVSLDWSFSRYSEDVHLMRGRSASIVLRERLRVTSKPNATSPAGSPENLVTFLTNNPDTACIFKPNFKATLNPTTNEFEGFGVRVHASTGEVTAGLNTSAHPLFNFTILVSLLANRNDAASPRKRAYLRVHLHNHVSKAWLSPSRMRVPKGIGGFSFSAFAQFDDETIAKLNTLDATTSGTSNIIDWFSEPQDKVDNNTGFITLAASDADDSEINVRAVLTSDFLNATGGPVEAAGVVIPYTLPRVARLLAGSAGYERRHEVPNFIFLADGFQAGDQPRFNAMTDLFMKDLRQNDKFKPFDRLVGSMNFWRVFVPSAARGVGTRFEVFGEGRASPISVLDKIFDPENDSPISLGDLNNDEWGPNQIRLYFGLPLLLHKGMANGDIRAYWKQISYLPAGLIDQVPDGLINAWKKEGDRRLVDESDTFLGSCYGFPTSAKVSPFDDRTFQDAVYQENEQRFPRHRLNRFLTNLQYQDQNGVLHPLGPLWDKFAAAPDGKDAEFVIILLCADSGRARKISGQLYTNIIDKERQYVAIEADAAVNTGFAEGKAVKMKDLDGGRLPADLPLMPGKSTLLHEIGHSLGLADEYGELGITMDDPRLVYTGSGNINSDRYASNVQVKSDLVLTPGGDDIDVSKIKWRWHRIAKSGVLAPLAPPAPAAITKSGFRYTIKLKPGQAAVFKEGNIVILRRRTQGESILQDIEYSQVSPRYQFVTRSPEFVVLHVDPVASEVEVEIARDVVGEPVDDGPLIGHDLVADFPAECVLYEPQPARYFYPPTGENLEIIAANILEFMAGTRRPVHENLDAQGHPIPDSEAEQNPDLSDPALAEITGIAGCAKKNRDIVALYAGGNTYHHGVYHATGHCIMRHGKQIAEFCSVCRYILTDFIDPSLHPEVDRLFEQYYPLKIP